MFRPYSQKNVSLVRYDRLVNYPIIKIKTQKAWTKLQKLIENLNSYERKFALSLQFHPYHLRYKHKAETQMHLARTGTPTQEIKDFEAKQEQQDFPFWNKSKRIKFITETQ